MVFVITSDELSLAWYYFDNAFSLASWCIPKTSCLLPIALLHVTCSHKNRTQTTSIGRPSRQQRVAGAISSPKQRISMKTRTFSFFALPLRTVVALAASASATNMALAQTAEVVTPALPAVTVTGKAGGPINLESESKAGSRLGLSLRETPASVEIISRDAMEQRGARTLEEALRGAVGVTVGGNPGSPGIASTRGFTGGFITYLFDGSRVSTPTMSNRPQDSWNYERIEVLKGPSSVLYGEGGIGGAVNFVPKQPDRHATGTEALLSYGSYGSLRAGVGAGGALGENAAYRVDFSHNESRGWIDRTGQKLDHLTAAMNFALSPAVSLDFSADAMRDDIESYWGTPLVPASFATEPTKVVSDSAGRVIDQRLARTNYNVADGVMESDSLWLRAKLSWQITPQWRLRNELSTYEADRHWRNAESLSFVAPDRLNRDQVDIAHDHKVLSNRIDLSHQGRLAGLKNRFVIGLDYSKTDFSSERRFSDGSASTNAALQVAVVNPAIGFFNGDPALATGAGNRTNITAKVDNTALFAEDALNVNNALTLVAGLRTEYLSLDRSINDLNTGTFTAFGTSYKPNSARLGVVYDLTPTTTLYAQVVKAAAAVGSSNLLLQSSTNSNFPLTRGQQTEVGLKQSLANQRFNWTLALYQIEQSNVLSRDAANPAVTVNNGQLSSQGIELAAAWRATRELTLSGNVAVLDAQFDTLVEAGGVSRVGNLPPNVPKRVGRAWADYRFTGLPLHVGAGLSGTAGSYTNNANTVRINGYYLGDAYASWRLKPALLTLRVRNITDKLYATWGGASASNQVILGAPRTVELSAKLDF
jgi:iron complex outermembrane recepter protein